jgi:hypothetical protein
MAQIMWFGSAILCVFLGVILHFFGRKFSNFIFGIIFIVAQILFGLSNNNFQLYIPAYTAIAIGITNFNKKLVWHNGNKKINLIRMIYLTYSLDLPEYTGFINGIITAAFDLGTLIYLIINFLYFKIHFSISLSFIILGCLGKNL